MPDPDFQQVQPELKAICEIFRITKIGATIYQNSSFEELGKGESLDAYDSGEKGHVAYTDRIVTEMPSILSFKILVKDGSEPWTDEEADTVKFFLNTLISYISKSKLKSVAKTYAYYDDDGYPNFRYHIHNIKKAAQEGTIAGKVAINFNLRHFSLVNQQIGRKLGTFVMRSFINTLSEMIKGTGEVCRLGGDNFALLCGRQCLNNVLGHLSGAAVVYDTNTGDRIKISASAGVYIIPDDFVMNDLGDILDKVIPAANAAKVSGEHYIVFFNDDMIADKERIMRIQHLFPIALDNSEYHVFYQPKVNINTGELVGAEALCRWFHDGKIIPPKDFIPILELGLEICKLDFYVLDSVCRDIRRWIDEKKNVVRVSVNFSRKHMVDIDFHNHILEIIDRNGVPHEYIEIELTETTTDVEFRDLKRIVNGLQRAGVCTSVDDFGMGYSSLNLIKEIPWDVVKVDRNFLPEHENDKDMVRDIMFRHVVSMANELGLECVAEGVETQEQVEILKQNQCDIAQGFLFDKPLPVNEFENKLTMRKYDLIP